MAELVFDAGFFDDLQQVELASKQDEILDTIELLLTIPEMGSKRLPASIVQEFGPQVRKLVVKPFLVIYELMDNGETIYVHGLLHARNAW
ncbi:MAG: type II toxin-antitoxin system RelE/ParE family toxin [Eggerthellaceae bacterium]|nr:type II toxin-antitoxin system RelE/ParE family toxin [Eggerthellaceae bacterium]